MALKSKPYQISWDGDPKSLEEVNKHLQKQLTKIDEMFQQIYTNVQTVEGNWTPVDQSGGLLTFADPTGRYIKMGPLVVATAYLKFPTTADTNASLISGLPFAVDTSSIIQYGGNVVTSDETTLARAFINTTGYISFRTTANAVITNSTLSTNLVYFTLIYRTTE